MEPDGTLATSQPASQPPSHPCLPGLRLRYLNCQPPSCPEPTLPEPREVGGKRKPLNYNSGKLYPPPHRATAHTLPSRPRLTTHILQPPTSSALLPPPLPLPTSLPETVPHVRADLSRMFLQSKPLKSLTLPLVRAATDVVSYPNSLIQLG